MNEEHGHSGMSGDGKKINSSNISNFNLPYGHMYGNTDRTVPVAIANTWYEVNVASPDFIAGELNNVTFSDHYLQIQKAGRYLITFGMALETTTANDEVAGTVAINGTASETSHGHSTIAAANASVQLAGTTILNLSVGDQISFAVKNYTAARNIIVSHAQLSIVLIK